MTLKNGPHAEERSQSTSRRTHIAFYAVLAAAFLASSCSDTERRYPAVRSTIGDREPLRTGRWRGQIGMTEVDFSIDQVAAATVSVRVSGSVLRQAGQPQPASAVDTYFYDRPRSCKRTGDGRSFDCTRYTDMHIDNGQLCGVYEASGQVYRPCLDPVP